jgi:hypothetical protein
MAVKAELGQKRLKSLSCERKLGKVEPPLPPLGKPDAQHAGDVIVAGAGFPQLLVELRLGAANL